MIFKLDKILMVVKHLLFGQPVDYHKSFASISISEKKKEMKVNFFVLPVKHETVCMTYSLVYGVHLRPCRTHSQNKTLLLTEGHR